MPLGKNGKFAKTIFYFLRADKFWRYDISVTGNAVNLKDGDGMQVPCVLRLSGQKKHCRYFEEAVNVTMVIFNQISILQ